MTIEKIGKDLIPLIETIGKEPVPLTEVAKLSKKSIYAVRYWIHTGVRGVRLASFLIGGRRFCNREGIETFLRETNQAPHYKNRASANAAPA